MTTDLISRQAVLGAINSYHQITHIRAAIEAIPAADALSDLQAENQRLRKIIDKMEWQPIETAPKDGSLVLLHTPDTHTYTPVLGTWNYFEESWEEWGDYCQCYPTHWMPLPEPPKEANHDD